jgi:asparagine synthase (glutamine-hydrolysing)
MNYVAGPISILKDVKKLLPGHSMLISSAGISEMKPYYSIPYSDQSVHVSMTYEEAKTELHRLVHESVQLRLIADVPLGAFLSGGIDSSIIVSTAVQYKKDLNTFSIGFKDEPYFDETKYANLVAKKFKTNHTVFSVTNENMYEQLFNILDYIDEPFADSSAIAVFILSKLTREKVTVALSGDGGDELFAGYNKHKAEWRARNGGIANHLIKMGAPLWSLLPKSRNSKIGNIFRQLERFSEGLQKSDAERYWRWCSFIDDEEAMHFVKKVSMEDMNEYASHKQHFTSMIKKNGRFDDTLLADMNLLLPNDMLTKVDLMSMANSLEVRVPLLDHHIINFAFSLPTAFKINANDNKRLLKDAFRDELPEELFTRPKHGFEVPLLNWFRTGLRSLIFDDLLEDTFIETQNIFELEKIKMLKKQLLSNNPGDVVAQIWGLIVFQYWWKKYMQD